MGFILVRGKMKLRQADTQHREEVLQTVVYNQYLQSIAHNLELINSSFLFDGIQGERDRRWMNKTIFYFKAFCDVSVLSLDNIERTLIENSAISLINILNFFFCFVYFLNYMALEVRWGWEILTSLIHFMNYFILFANITIFFSSIRGWLFLNGTIQIPLKVSLLNQIECNRSPPHRVCQIVEFGIIRALLCLFCRILFLQLHELFLLWELSLNLLHLFVVKVFFVSFIRWQRRMQIVSVVHFSSAGIAFITKVFISSRLSIFACPFYLWVLLFDRDP